MLSDVLAWCIRENFNDKAIEFCWQYIIRATTIFKYLVVISTRFFRLYSIIFHWRDPFSGNAFAQNWFVFIIALQQQQYTLDLNTDNENWKCFFQTDDAITYHFMKIHKINLDTVERGEDENKQFVLFLVDEKMIRSANGKITTMLEQ